jgi:hypothetical protein
MNKQAFPRTVRTNEEHISYKTQECYSIIENCNIEIFCGCVALFFVFLHPVLTRCLSVAPGQHVQLSDIGKKKYIYIY